MSSSFKFATIIFIFAISDSCFAQRLLTINSVDDQTASPSPAGSASLSSENAAPQASDRPKKINKDDSNANKIASDEAISKANSALIKADVAQEVAKEAKEIARDARSQAKAANNSELRGVKNRSDMGVSDSATGSTAGSAISGSSGSASKTQEEGVRDICLVDPNLPQCKP